ncbi:MAG: MerR family transcriptional regulator [Cyclobacteriaceae bacterium]
MLIGELSRNSGLSRDTIRWYEKVGLLRGENTLRDSNNYRIYDQVALDTLLLIKQSKSFGFSLQEVREILDLIESENLNCDSASPIIQSKLHDIDQKISFLQNIRTKLIELKEQCSGDCQNQILGNTSNKQ